MPIEIKDLSYVYSMGSPFEKAALRDVNLSVIDGEFLGVIGHTGSGKSTLVSHLNALTKIQSGVIIVDNIILRGKAEIKAQKEKNKADKKARKGKGGESLEQSYAETVDLSCVKKPDYRLLRAKVGMVFQYPEYQLFDETVFKDVAFGPKNLGISAEETAVRVKEAIEMVGLNFEEIKERSPFELSGGQKRRVALAGVLAMRPQVLVLDEPTAGLDPRGKREILALVQSIKKQMRNTIIMISHNMDEIAEVSDRIAVMADGKLQCILPPRELFSRRELLTQHNIQMPMVTQIACALAERGVDVPKNIITQSELVAAVLVAKGKGQNDGTDKIKGGAL